MRQLLNSRWLKWITLAIALTQSAYSGSGWRVLCIRHGNWFSWFGPSGCYVDYGRVHWATTGLYDRPPGGEDSYFPSWCKGVAILVATLVLCCRDWRTPVLRWLGAFGYPPGSCQACGYDLTGNISGVCPECGKIVLVSNEKPRSSAVAEVAFVLLLVVVMLLVYAGVGLVAGW